MNPIVKNLLALIAGLIAGSIANMALIMISGSVIPLPEGADVSTMEALEKSMPLFESKHFIFPFLAHAFGTLVGALVAASIAASHKMKIGLAIGGLFLIAGIYNVMNLPAPMWFEALDLIGAYIPMAYIGYQISTRLGT